MRAMHELLKQNQDIWGLFTRKEEYSPRKLDERGRFFFDGKNLVNTSDPEASRYLIDRGMQVEFPENKTFAVCLTHDVDDVYPPLSHSLLSSVHCLKNLDFRDFTAQLLWKLRGKEYSPYLNLSKIMDLEAGYGAKSSFYFIATEADPIRFRYDIEDIESHLKEVLDRGWEVGLHGGYYSYNNLEALKKEKKRLETVLGKAVQGFRNHYLRFKTPDSWEILADAGFRYDSTFGYHDCAGFRNGMCHPFKPYNLNTGKEIDILEIPLIVMDVALFAESKSFGEAWERTKKLIDITASLNGVITLLWHNFVFGCNFRDDWVRLYEKVLQYCSERGAWMTSGEEIYRWWGDGA
ncbi:MAG: polysaccharide deacetylase family protein [Methanosarcina sp.]|nr:polysaccharide deacetylase family protein [Methanosarcina sp.]MDD3873038.1 polysaccharide deacetylase family protein [Methanosarcina sp.]MDD4521637.1 polysaccharide deacetylase family protein [Methanosarcina sp.]